MVSREVVMQTVKRMYGSGVDEETIRDTLRDVGLEEKEIADVMAEAKGAVQRQPARAVPAAPVPRPPAPEEIARKAAEHVGRRVDEAHEVQAMRAETLHAEVAEHGEALRKVAGDIKALREAVPAGTGGGPQLDALQKKLNAMDREIADIKAATSALQTLLKKILDANRQLLQKGGRKK